MNVIRTFSHKALFPVLILASCCVTLPAFFVIPFCQQKLFRFSSFPLLTFISRFLLGWRDLNPCRFWPAGFRSCRVKTLANTSSIRCGLCLAWTKISSGKTALHPTVDNFWAIFVFWGAGLLTQVKTKRAKSAEKGHWRATWVWIPSA